MPVGTWDPNWRVMQPLPENPIVAQAFQDDPDKQLALALVERKAAELKSWIFAQVPEGHDRTSALTKIDECLVACKIGIAGGE